jgi:hypothetical protein
MLGSNSKSVKNDVGGLTQSILWMMRFGRMMMMMMMDSEKRMRRGIMMDMFVICDFVSYANLFTIEMRIVLSNQPCLNEISRDIYW